jgi:hypothetical protein
VGKATWPDPSVTANEKATLFDLPAISRGLRIGKMAGRDNDASRSAVELTLYEGGTGGRGGSANDSFTGELGLGGRGGRGGEALINHNDENSRISIDEFTGEERFIV